MENISKEMCLLWVVIAIVLGMIVGYSLGKNRKGQNEYQEPNGQKYSQHDMSPETNKAVKLREAMRKLWADHVVWTRIYIMDAVSGMPDKDAASKRLLQNQEDIGAAVGDYYGKDAVEILTDLLKEQ